MQPLDVVDSDVDDGVVDTLTVAGLFVQEVEEGVETEEEEELLVKYKN